MTRGRGPQCCCARWEARGQGQELGKSREGQAVLSLGSGQARSPPRHSCTSVYLSPALIAPYKVVA